MKVASSLHSSNGIISKDDRSSILRQYVRLRTALDKLFHFDHGRYSAWALGSARAATYNPEHPEYQAVRKLFNELAFLGAGAGTGGGPGIMEAGNRGHQEGYYRLHGEGANYAQADVLNLAVCLKIGHEEPNPFANGRMTLSSFDARIGVFTHFGDAFVCAKGGVGTILENFVIDERMEEIKKLGRCKDGAKAKDFMPPILLLSGKEHYRYYQILAKELEALKLNPDQLNAHVVDGLIRPSPLEQATSERQEFALDMIREHMTRWSSKRRKAQELPNRKELNGIMREVLQGEQELARRIQLAFKPLTNRFTVCISGGDGLRASAKEHQRFLTQAYELARMLTLEGVQVVSPGLGEISHAVQKGFDDGYAKITNPLIKNSLIPPVVFSLQHNALDDVMIRPRLLSALGSSHVIFPGGLSTQTDFWYMMQLNQFMHGKGNPAELNEALKHALPLAQLGGWRPSLYIQNGTFNYLEAAEHACHAAKTAIRPKSHKLSDAPAPGARNTDGEFQYRRFDPNLRELVERLKLEQAVFNQAACSIAVHGGFLPRVTE